MKSCSVCLGQINQESEIAVLFIDKSGSDKEICEKCEHQFDILMNSESQDNIKRAISYLDKYKKLLNDDEVISYLDEIITVNNQYLDDDNASLKKDQLQQKTSKSSVWVSLMRSYAWLILVGIIISGINIATPFFRINKSGIGLLIVITYIGLAVFGIASIMIFLDAADDLRSTNKNIIQIKELLEKNNK